MRRLLSAVSAAMVLAAAAAADDPPTAPVKPPSVRVVAFSPDGKLLAAGYAAKDRPGGAVVWEVATGERLWHSPGPAVTAVSFAPDGSALAVARGMPASLAICSWVRPRDSRSCRRLAASRPASSLLMLMTTH